MVYTSHLIQKLIYYLESMIMNKIKRASHWFHLFFQICLFLTPLLLVLSWIYATQQTFQSNHPNLFLSPVSQNLLTTPVLSPLNPLTKLLGFLVSCIPVGIDMLIFYFLIQLFKLYERGEIFTRNNVKYIRNIGYAMLGSQLIQPIYQALMTFILTMNNPKGHRLISIGFGTTDIMLLLTALIIILISWIMTEGYKLNDEQKYTV